MTRTHGFALLIVVALVAFAPRMVGQQPEVPSPPTTTAPVVEVPGSLPTPATDDRPSQSAVPVKEVPSPASPSNPTESLQWGLGAALVVEYLKKKKWFTFLNEDSSARAKAIFGFLAALVTTAGIQFAVSGSVLDAGGASVTVTGITFTGIKDVLFQWIAQQGWFLALLKKNDPAPVVARA